MTLGRWWRAYDDALNSPKLQRLPGETFKGWFNLCCLASANGGRLPRVEDIAFALRKRPDQVAALIKALQRAGLIDEVEGGFAPHNWNERQFRSDVSTDRVRRHRERKRNVSSTVSETPPDTDTDTDTDTDDDDDDGARARDPSLSRPQTDPEPDTTPRKSAISAEAHQLADDIRSAVGGDPQDPLLLVGLAYRAQAWIEKGWEPQAVVIATKAITARKRDGKPGLAYLEKALPDEVARLTRPVQSLPVDPQENPQNVHAPRPARRPVGFAELALQRARAAQ